MAEDYPSSNPFRRKSLSAAPSTSLELSKPDIIPQIPYQQSHALSDTTNLQRIDAPKKATKKVRVQSPPPPSPSTPSLPDSSSTIGEDIYTKSAAVTPRDDDPFDSTNSDSSQNEQSSRPSQAPPNPFSRTLATMEHSDQETSAAHHTNTASTGRASMNVDAFKRLLMTGDAGLGPHTATPANIHHGLGDGGSSTDASSLSRQSTFEPAQEVNNESPRTSHEISEPDDDRRGLVADIPTSMPLRKKPPPPSSRHGRLIKMELRDDPSTFSTSAPVTSPPLLTPGSNTSQHYFTPHPPNHSNTDLNKPLPPAPKRSSYESDRESIFDKESAGRTPEPASAPIQRKQPPAPPLARRHSQMVSESRITRETGRLSPKAEQEGTTDIAATEHGRPRSNSGKVPPPPPSRRPGSIRHSSHHSPVASPSSVSVSALPPPTPPTRGSSRSISGRPPSVISMDMSTTKRTSVPPPPPPSRHGRSSMDDGSRRTSREIGRQSSESARKVSGASVAEDIENTAPDGADILAEMTKLQREIDALRTQSEKPGVP